MRLSTAIALGRALLNPVAGTITDHNGGGCALGMAYTAGGLMKNDIWDTTMQAQAIWPHLNAKTGLPCDCYGDVMGSGCSYYPTDGRNEFLISAIVHLFNYHVMTAKDWTLDQLIDWIRSVEPQEQEESCEQSKSLAGTELSSSTKTMPSESEDTVGLPISTTAKYVTR